MRVDVANGGVLLLLDTCGERGSLALYRGATLLGEILLQERAASSACLGAVRALLASHGIVLRELAGIGLVSGPGSFTGVRVGLALAKGLCEAANLPVAAVSRLAVLAEAAGLREGYAVLAAGRDQFYVRVLAASGAIRECIAGSDELQVLLQGAEVAVESATLGEKFQIAGTVHIVALRAHHAIGPVHACFAKGGSDLPSLDANYLREETQIYRRGGSAEVQVLAR